MTSATAIAGPGTIPERDAAQRTLKAPLFGSLIERMDDDRRTVVLDLGAAQGATIALLNQFRCRLDIVDLGADLIALNALEAEDDLPGKLARLLPSPRRTDVVLCWELPNYVNRPVLSALMLALKPFLHQRSLVHMLIRPEGARLPAQPSNYYPSGRDHLVRVPVSDTERDASYHTPQSLARCMPDYQPEKIMLLGNGMQEFLFYL